MRDRGLYAQRLAKFLGLNTAEVAELMARKVENPRKSALELRYIALRSKLALPSMSRFLPKSAVDAFQSVLRRGAPAKAALPAAWINEMRVRYAPSNAR